MTTPKVPTIVALAAHDPVVRLAVRDALQRLIKAHDGNAAAAARALGLASGRPLLATLQEFGLIEWLEATWPGRSAGGRPPQRGG